LYKKLQSITGLAPSEFIRSIRLKRAAQLLTQGNYPVAEVAEKVGFNTQKYFSKYFKESFGVSPSKYAQNGNNADNELL
jgi:AraC-like DNA-binding protein